MIKNKILTIGVPTFNRVKTLIKCLDSITQSDILEKINVLVIDNNSEDQTYDILVKRYNRKIEIIKNSENIGFSKNTIKLFKYCKTDYLLWLPDEDFLEYKNINNLLDIINKKELYFICTQYYLNKKLYRGKRLNKSLAVSDLWSASSHLSGIVFNTNYCKTVVENFDKISNDYKVLSKYYPQIFLLINLMILDLKKCVYLNFNVCYEKNKQKESHVLNQFGDHYGDLVTKWEIHKELISYLKYLIKNDRNEISIKLLDFQKKRILKTIRLAIENESDELIRDFDKERYRYLVFSILTIIPKLLLKPLSIFRNLYNLFLIKK